MRHKATEPSRAQGKSLQEQVGERCERRKSTERESQREIEVGGEREREERKKVRQGDGKCSGEEGYLCLGVVGTAGRHLKGSQVC